METLKSGSFGQLFQVTFVVAATFQVAAALLGLVFALIAPSGFTLNGQQATNVGEAITALVIVLVVGLLLNAAMSAGGAGLWTVLRKFLFKKPAPASAA